MSRLITTLAAEVGPVLAAINTARAARAHAWDAAGAAAPDVHCAQGGLVVVDLDASLLTAHSEKNVRRQPTSGVRVSPVVCVRRSRAGRHW